MLQMSPNMFSHVFLTSRPVRFITIPPSSLPWHLEVSRITTVQASRSPSRSVCSDPALLKVLLTAMSSGQLRPDMRWPTWELLRPKKIVCHIYIYIYIRRPQQTAGGARPRKSCSLPSNAPQRLCRRFWPSAGPLPSTAGLCTQLF